MKKSIEIRAVVNYLHILRPVRRPTERKSYYRLDVLIDKQDVEALETIREATECLLDGGDFTSLLKDGDEKGHTLYKGCYYFTAKRASDLDPMKVEGMPRNGTVASIKLMPLRAYVGGAQSVTFRLESISFSN